MTERKKQNWDRVRWTPFVEIDPPFGDELRSAPLLSHGETRWVANSIYVVLVQTRQDTAPAATVVHLAITTHDGQPRHDWRELQRIKSEIVGRTVEAVELFPSENVLPGGASWVHLCCFPRLAEGRHLPWGHDARFAGLLEPRATNDARGRCPRDGSPVVLRRGAPIVRRLGARDVAMRYAECVKEGHVFLVPASEEDPRP